MASGKSTGKRRAVIVHGIEDARAAAEAARSLGAPVLLVSAPGAAAYAGAPWFREIVRAVRAEFPEADIAAVLDCGDRPGWALAAIRDGAEAIRFHGRPAVREKVARIAEAAGTRMDADRARALDLEGARDPEAACRVWLSGGD